MRQQIGIRLAGSALWQSRFGLCLQPESACLCITFDKLWDGLVKRVCLRAVQSERAVQYTLPTRPAAAGRACLCALPREALARPGQLTVVIEGWQAGRRVRALCARLQVAQAPGGENGRRERGQTDVGSSLYRADGAAGGGH